MRLENVARSSTRSLRAAAGKCGAITNGLVDHCRGSCARAGDTPRRQPASSATLIDCTLGRRVHLAPNGRAHHCRFELDLSEPHALRAIGLSRRGKLIHGKQRGYELLLSAHSWSVRRGADRRAAIDVTGLNNLAAVLHATNRLAEAEPLHRRARHCGEKPSRIISLRGKGL